MSLVYIPYSKVTAITADKADANFPVTYALTNHPRQVWKSTDETGTITVDVSEVSDGVFIDGTNAEEVSITVKSADGAETLVAEATYDLSGITTLEEFMVGSAVDVKSFYWYCYPQLVATPSKVEINFSKAVGDPVECGVVWVGLQNKTEYGINKGFEDSYLDYSYKEEQAFNNGAAYIFQRETARSVSGSIVGSRAAIESHYKVFRHQIGPNPFPVKLVDTVSGDMAFFARFKDPPKRTVDREFSSISMQLIERL